MTFLTTLVLARLLLPEAFGIVALALLAINVFDRLKDVGVFPALIQSGRPWSTIAPTGLTLTVLGTMVAALCCLLGAPLLAGLLAPGPMVVELTPLIRALSASLLLSGLGMFADAALSRHLLFRQRVAPEIVATAIRSAVSIGLALDGAGAWSLVWGQVVGSGVQSLGYWLMSARSLGSAPRPGFNRVEAGRLIRFGLPLSWVALLSLILDNTDYFVIGHRLGAEQLGYYTIAFRVPEMVVVGTCIAIGKVLFSAFSRSQHSIPQLREQYLNATRAVVTLTIPMGVGIAVTADPLVRVLFGDAYLPSIPLVTILGLQAAVFSMTFHSGEVYKALGRASILTRLALAQVAVFAAVLWTAAGYSVLWVAVGFLGCHLLMGVVRLFIISRILDISTRRLLGPYWPALVAAASMALGCWLLSPGLAGLPVVLRLAVLVIAGGLLYLVTLTVVSPASVLDHPLTRMLRRRF